MRGGQRTFTDARLAPVEEIRHRVACEPPPRLAAIYPLDDLMTHEIMAIFRRE